MQIDVNNLPAAVACRWLAAGLCAILLIALVMTAMRSPGTPPRPDVSGSGTAQALNWRWFDSGRSGSTGTDTTVTRENLAEASVDGTLHGVVILGDRAYATLRMAGREERVYRVGDELQSGVEIVAIEPGRVIVRQNGLERQVTLPQEGRYLRSPREPVGVDVGETGNQVQVAGFSAAQVAVEGYEGGLQLDSVPDDVGNLGALQSGDVIVDIDGVDIQTLMSDPTLWAQYSSNTALPVTVLRDGETVTLSVNAQGLAARLMPALGGSNNLRGN